MSETAYVISVRKTPNDPTQHGLRYWNEAQLSEFLKNCPKYYDGYDSVVISKVLENGNETFRFRRVALLIKEQPRYEYYIYDADMRVPDLLGPYPDEDTANRLCTERRRADGGDYDIARRTLPGTPAYMLQG